MTQIGRTLSTNNCIVVDHVLYDINSGCNSFEVARGNEDGE